MKPTILCINSGSSSTKFALYLVQEAEELIAEGAVKRIGLPGGWLWLKDCLGKRLMDSHADYADSTAPGWRKTFESLNPGNTLWTKQYNLYSHVDTDEERY
ncbi:MAG: DUF3141 domain-containing protein, partial [Desulfobacterales bacterium]